MAAHDLCEKALELNPDASTHEMLGDLLMELGRAEEAQKHFKEALSLQPGRVSAEAKLGRATLELDRRILQIEEARRLLDNPNELNDNRHNSGMATFLSAVFPGFGQIYKEEYQKGAALMVFQILCLAYLGASKGTSALIRMFGPDKDTASIGPLTVLVLAVSVSVYIYSIVDASVVKRSSKGVL